MHLPAVGRPLRLYAKIYRPADRDYGWLASALIETLKSVVHYDDRGGAVTEYRFGSGSLFEPTVAFFCHNIEHGIQGEQPIATGYDVDELISPVKRSAVTGMAVYINWRI